MTLAPAVGTGWRAGFANLLDKELGTWWRTRRWMVHLVLWSGIIGFFCFVIWLEQRHDWDGARGLRESTQLFFQLGGFFALLGAVLVTQSAIVGERRSGTAAWVLTKPTTRAAFVLAKFAGITLSFLLLSLVIPALVWHLQIWLQWRTLPAPPHFLEAAGLLALHQVFYIALALMLGTLVSHRGAVAGAALGFWVAGNILPGMLPAWVGLVMPWMLVRSAASVALWQPVPIPVWQPALATALWTTGFVAVALWRFEREEF
jgi:ABC-2 type transport system permease protein